MSAIPSETSDRRKLIQWLLGMSVASAAWLLAYSQLTAFADWVVETLGLSRQTRLGEAVHFFFYDSPKVVLLLTGIVFVMGIIQTFFSPERTRAMLSGKREGVGNVLAASLGIVTPFCSCSAVPLFIGFLSAGVPLAFEPIERGIMHRAPRRLAMPVLDAHLIRRIVLVSILLLAGAFGLFLRELDQGHTLAEARTVAVNVFVMVEMTYLFNCRSLTRGFWSQGLFSNPWIWAGVGIMLGLQLLLTYAPVMNQLFQTAPIGLEEWLEIIVVAVLCSLVIAAEKWLTGIRAGRG